MNTENHDPLFGNVRINPGTNDSTKNGAATVEANTKVAYTTESGCGSAADCVNNANTIGAPQVYEVSTKKKPIKNNDHNGTVPSDPRCAFPACINRWIGAGNPSS